MIIRVITKLAPQRLHPHHFIREGFHLCAYHKEGGLYLIFFQTIQKPHGKGAWPVVKGKSYGSGTAGKDSQTVADAMVAAGDIITDDPYLVDQTENSILTLYAVWKANEATFDVRVWIVRGDGRLEHLTDLDKNEDWKMVCESETMEHNGVSYKFTTYRTI